MATKTSFLQLTLPLNSEYQDTWDEPNNKNFEILDAWAEGVDTEIVDARFSKTSLKAFLQEGHNNDGSLKATPEVITARTSFAYGELDSLSERLNLGDKEVFKAREALPALRDNLALKTYMQGAILSGTKNVNGYPTWLGFTGANALIDGSVTNIIALIDGKKGRTRVVETLTLSGSAGIKYIYATFNEDGVIRVDGDSSTPPPAVPAGTIGADILGDTTLSIFEDATTDFTTKDVKVGDILTVLGVGGNAGQYIIQTIAPFGDVNQLKIIGIFPGVAQASIDYTVSDPLALSFGFDIVKTPATGKLYIGEADFDGAAVTAVRAIHFNDVFVGEWRPVDVTSTPVYTETWNHNLFDDKLEVIVQVSAANNGTQPITNLDIGSLSSTLALAFSNTQLFSAGGPFDPGTSDATYTPAPSLTGTVTSSLGGTVYLDNAVRMQFTTTQVSVKNPVAGKFYKDFSGADQTVGYIRVIVRRKA